MAAGQLQGGLVVHRFSADGAWDPSYQSPTNWVGSVSSLVASAAGGVYLAGRFDAPASCLVLRLRPDGKADETFLCPSGDAEVLALAETSSGRLLIGGRFAKIGSADRWRLALLEADGALIEAFQPHWRISGNPSASIVVSSLLALDENSFLIGGLFDSYQGVAVPGLVKLNGQGKVDPAFVPGFLNVAGPVACMARQSDGRLILGGSFSLGSKGRAHILRIGPNGALDSGFGPSMLDFEDKVPSQLLVDARDRILVLDSAGILRRLENSGQGDVPFLPNGMKSLGGVSDSQIYGVLTDLGLGRVFAERRPGADTAPSILIPGGRAVHVLFQEGYSYRSEPTVLGNPKPGLQWLLNGVPIPGETNSAFRQTQVVRSGLGNLSLVASNRAGVVTQDVAALTAYLTDSPAGAIDRRFRFDDLPIIQPTVLGAVPSGGMLVGGRRLPHSERPSVDLVRLTDLNAVDPAFSFHSPETIARLNEVKAFTNGWVAVAAAITPQLGFTQQVVLWLDPTGQARRTTRLEGGAVIRMYELNEGKVWMVGEFTKVDTSVRNRVAVFTTTGELTDQASWMPLPDRAVRAMVRDGRGSYWFGGDFRSIGGIVRTGIVRFTSQGELDQSPGLGTGFNDSVTDLLAPTPDTVWAGGRFTSFNAQAVGRVVRLSMEGTLLPVQSVLEFSRFALDHQGRVWIASGGLRGGLRLLPSGQLATNGVFVPRRPGDQYQTVEVSRSGRAYVSGNLGFQRCCLEWPYGIGILVEDDELPSEPPRFLAPPVWANNINVAPVSGRDLHFRWYREDRLILSRDDIAHYATYDGATPLVLVVSNRFGSVTSAPVFYTPLPRSVNTRALPARITAFEGDPLILTMLDPSPPAVASESQWFFGPTPIDSLSDLLLIPSLSRADQGCYSTILRTASSWDRSGTEIVVTRAAPWEETLESSGLKYVGDPGGGWEPLELRESDGTEVRALSSKPAPAGEVASFGVHLYGRGNLTFRWKFVSSSPSNRFSYQVGEGKIVGLEPAPDWQETTLPITFDARPWASAVRWTFVKQEGGVESEDRVLIDHIRFTPAEPARILVRRQPTDVSLEPGSLLQLVPMIEGNPPLRYQWFRDGLEVAGATQPFFRTVAEAGMDGLYSLRIEGPETVVLTKPAKVSIRSTTLRLGVHQLSPEGGLEVSVTADPAWTVVLERSVNLESWEVLKVFGSGEILTLTIPSSHALPSQFFRARTP